MKRVAILKVLSLIILLSLVAVAQDSAQQTPTQGTQAPAGTQTAPSQTTPAKKPVKKAASAASASQGASTGTSGAHKTGTSAHKATGAASSAKKSTSGTAAKTGLAKAAAAKPVDPNADRPTPEEVSAMTTNPEVIFDTSMGKMKCELFPKQAPKTVANFIGLAQGTKHWTDPKTGQKVEKPLFDGTIFHRVIPNFMIQGGDPLGNGTGDPGYRFEDEFSPELRFDRPGRLAMANSGPTTNGSQFFITEVPTPHLNDHHTIFGQCDDASVELVKQIARVATDPRNNRPDLDVTLNHVEILGGPKKPVVTRKPTVTKKTIPRKTSAATPPKQ